MTPAVLPRQAVGEFTVASCVCHSFETHRLHSHPRGASLFVYHPAPVVSPQVASSLSLASAKNLLAAPLGSLRPRLSDRLLFLVAGASTLTIGLYFLAVGATGENHRQRLVADGFPFSLATRRPCPLCCFGCSLCLACRGHQTTPSCSLQVVPVPAQGASIAPVRLSRCRYNDPLVRPLVIRAAIDLVLGWGAWVQLCIWISHACPPHVGFGTLVVKTSCANFLTLAERKKSNSSTSTSGVLSTVT